jgi:ABC-type sulfate transport system permease component
VANFVYQQAIDMWNFPAAAAAAMILLAFSLLLIGAVNLVFDRYARRFAVA